MMSPRLGRHAAEASGQLPRGMSNGAVSAVIIGVMGHTAMRSAPRRDRAVPQDAGSVQMHSLAFFDALSAGQGRRRPCYRA